MCKKCTMENMEYFENELTKIFDRYELWEDENQEKIYNNLRDLFIRSKFTIILKPNSLIAVDMDGVLCEGEFWNDSDPKPIKKNIEIVEKLYRAGHHIIIYSARHRKYYQTTEAWLIKNGVYYHALSLEKLGCDLYIDDKAVNVKDIDKLI